MKKILVCLITGLLFLSAVNAQDTAIIRQINEQVWKPFISSFNSNNDEAFSAVHSKEVSRITQDDKRIIGYNEYFKKVPDSVKAKWGNWKKNIELRFTQRITSADKAFDVGYYKTTSTNTQTGEIRTGMGKFHVLLRKENGVWKILMDTDTSEGANEEVFNKAMKME